MYNNKKTKKFQFVSLLSVGWLVLLLIGCEQTSTGLISTESEELKYHHNLSNSDIQLTDETLRIGAEAIKVAIQKPEFLEEVYIESQIL